MSSSLILLCFGQNSTSQIEITNIVEAKTAEAPTLNDGDNCAVWLRLSPNGGTSYKFIPESNPSRDAGEIITESKTYSLARIHTDLADEIVKANIQIFASNHLLVDIADRVSQEVEAEILDTLESIITERHSIEAPASQFAKPIWLAGRKDYFLYEMEKGLNILYMNHLVSC